MPEQGEEVIIKVVLKAEATQIFIDALRHENSEFGKHPQELLLDWCKQKLDIAAAEVVKDYQIALSLHIFENGWEAKHDENLARRTAAEHAEEECLRQTRDL